MKKGFTLIELISVILIIGVIALITTPITLNLIKNSKQKAYERTILSIEQAASNYSIYNELGYSSSYKSLNLSEMQAKGYLNDSDIIDPRNDGVLEGCVVYRWLNETNQYEFKYKDNCNENLYPEVVINVINDNGNEWMDEKLRFELDNSYSSYKYCIGNNDCIPNEDYITTTTVNEVGQNIYICATGYFDEEVGDSSCTKAYKIDDTAPVLTVDSISTTSNSIIINASCNDDISGVDSLQYSINNGSYQSESVFSNLASGTYEIKIKCTNFSGIEEIATETRQTTVTSNNPIIAQLSQTPSSGTYASERVMRITYNGTGIENPGHYYSLDGNDWISVSGLTKDVTFTSDGYLYAKTVDEIGNTAGTATYTVSNIDGTIPNTSIASISTNADRAVISATCSDTESGITKYEFSSDNGSTWVNKGTTSNHIFTGLVQNTSYNFKVRCTNGSGLTNEDEETKATLTANNPVIAQLSQTPSSGDYARERVIRITYNGTGIENPSYYYSLDGNDWMSVSDLAKDVTFTSDGYLYAKTTYENGNTASTATYTVSNIDTTAPTVSASVSGRTATFTMSDNIGIVAYGINSSTTVEPTYTAITTTTSTTITWEASQAGSYVVWVKDVAGRVSNTTFTHEQSAFSYAATLASSTYTGAASCPSGYTQSGTNCTQSYVSGYSCPSGGSLSGSTCNTSYAAASTCTQYKCTLYTKCNHARSYICNASIVNNSCSGTANRSRNEVNCDKVRGYPHEWCEEKTYSRSSVCGGSETVYGSDCNNANTKVCNSYSYSCPSGGSLSGTTCNSSYGATAVYSTRTAGFTYSCNSGDSLSGSTCTHSYYTCPNGGTLSGTTCVFN